MPYQGNAASSVYCPLYKQSPGQGKLTLNGKCWFSFHYLGSVHGLMYWMSGEMLTFSWSTLLQSPGQTGVDRLAGWGMTKHSRPAACLSAGSRGTIQMHGLVEKEGGPDADILPGCFFQGTLSTQGDSLRAVQSTSLHWFLSVSAGDCPNQAGCSTEWQGKLSLSILSYTWSLIAFPLQGVLPLPPCSIGIKLPLYGLLIRMFTCWEICVLIGCRLQWALGVLLCLVVVLF